MEQRSATADELDTAEKLLNNLGEQIRATAREVNDEMDRRDHSFEAARLANAANDDEDDEDNSFQLYYLPDDDLGPGAASLRSGNNNGDDDDGDDADGPGKQPSPFAGEYGDAKNADVALDDQWRVEAVIGRRRRATTTTTTTTSNGKKKQLYYRVVWRNGDPPSWVPDERLENRAAVAAFEQQRAAAAKQTPSSGSPRLRPPVYVSRKRMERLRKKDAQQAELLEQQQGQLAVSAADLTRVGDEVIWSCEVEANIAIPYDLESQKTLEAAFLTRQPSTTIMVNGMRFTIDLVAMRQLGGSSRKVHRSIADRVPTASAPNVRSSAGGGGGGGGAGGGGGGPFDNMSVSELRDFVARAQSLNDPTAFQALSRLEELDKARPAGIGADAVKKFPRTTFAEVMTKICEGVEYPGFDGECAICLENFVGDDVLCAVPCKFLHMFHERCVCEYLSQYARNCPTCREQLG